MAKKASLETLNASRFNKVIDFTIKEITINPSGFKEEVETILKTTRALIEEVSYKEIYKVDKLDLMVTKKFITRYNKDLINIDLCIKYQGDDYRIKYIEDLEESNRFLIFICEKI